MKIENGIPITSWGSRTKYPFADMEVGDSFATDEKRVRAAVHTWSLKHGREFVTRKQTDGTIRVWRTA